MKLILVSNGEPWCARKAEGVRRGCARRFAHRAPPGQAGVHLGRVFGRFQKAEGHAVDLARLGHDVGPGNLAGRGVAPPTGSSVWTRTGAATTRSAATVTSPSVPPSVLRYGSSSATRESG